MPYLNRIWPDMFADVKGFNLAEIEIAEENLTFVDVAGENRQVTRIDFWSCIAFFAVGSSLVAVIGATIVSQQ